MEDQERSEATDVEGHRRVADFPAVEGIAEDEVDDDGDDFEAHQLRRPPTSDG